MNVNKFAFRAPRWYPHPVLFARFNAEWTSNMIDKMSFYLMF